MNQDNISLMNWKTSPLAKYIPFWSDLEMSHPEMSKKVALVANEQLLQALPQKMAYLISILKQNGVRTEGSGAERFEDAARWLGKHARLSQLSTRQKEAGREALTDVDPRLHSVIEEDDDDLDAPTYSMCLYVGYYLTELIRQEHSELQYRLFSHKGIIDHNRTVLNGKAPRVYLEPYILMRVICYKWTEYRNRDPQEDLKAFYENHVDALMKETI